MVAATKPIVASHTPSGRPDQPVAIHTPVDNELTALSSLDLAMPLPVLRNDQATLRELCANDAESLLAHISLLEVLRHIAPAPTTIEGFQSFIRWTHAQRTQRLHVAFGLIPAGMHQPVGILQCWPIEPDWSTAEWGFVVGRRHWGTGLFGHGARLLLDFAFDAVGVRRMEARSARANERGNGALRKLGAIPEGTLREGFRVGSQVSDYIMWSILAAEWRATPHDPGGRR
jgi:RimJ/RimL family protein N-acetyltransferase